MPAPYNININLFNSNNYVALFYKKNSSYLLILTLKKMFMFFLNDNGYVKLESFAIQLAGNIFSVELVFVFVLCRRAFLLFFEVRL